MEHDLRPAFLALVEVLVGVGRLVERQLVTDDPRRRRLSARDEVAQAPVVLLHRALPRPDLLTPEPELTEVDGEFALLGQLVWATRVLRDEDADDTDLTREAHRLDE